MNTPCKTEEEAEFKIVCLKADRQSIFCPIARKACQPNCEALVANIRDIKDNQGNNSYYTSCYCDFVNMHAE